MKTSSASIRSWSRSATSCSTRGSSITPESVLPTSISDSSCRDQRVADSYRRAFSTATAACAASSVITSTSSSVNSPSRFSVRYRFPYATPRSMIGTPRKLVIGGWFGGKPVESGWSPRSGEAKRLRVADQHAEDAAPARPLADQLLGVRVDAGDEEALEPRSRRIDHPERGVAGFGELGGRLGDELEHRVERELAADGDACLDQRAEALLHGAIIRRTTKGGRSRPSVASGVAAQLMATAVFCGAT